MNENANNILELRLISKERRLPKNFFGDSISEINLLVGSNGSGKTTIMRTICQWVCELSEGHYPRERGFLVFKEENHLSYAAFENGKEICVNTDSIDMDIFPIEPAEYFNDLRLIYFTNTRARLGIENYNILLDYSYSQRMKEANSNGHAMGEDIMENYERYEFDKQISVALDMDDFPIQYVFMEFKSVSFENIENLSSRYRSTITSDISGIWKCYFGNCEKISKEKRILIELLYIILYDMIKKLLKLKGEFSNRIQLLVEKKLSLVLQGDITSVPNLENGIKWIQKFLDDLLYECKNIYKNSSMGEMFEKYWGKTCNNIISFIDSFLSNQRREQIIKFFEIWEQVPTLNKEQKQIWQMKLKGNEEVFREFWDVGREIFLYIDDIYFFWNASSGEKSWAGLLPVLRSIPEGIQNVWFFLDEPDNTFHPEWERRLIKSIIDIVDNDKECYKQIWISTHSPIMLSDIPGPSVNYLKSDESKNKEVIGSQESKTFGQNIYYLYNNAFFLEDGVIGEFASEKIKELFFEIRNIKRDLLYEQKTTEEIKELKKCIDECEEIARIIAEPIFAKEIQEHLRHCNIVWKWKKGND